MRKIILLAAAVGAGATLSACQNAPAVPTAPAAPSASPAKAEAPTEAPDDAATLTAQFTPSGDLSGQIVNGVISARGARPYQAYLRVGGSMCGGSIISDQWILTAAHCVSGASASSATVRVGLNKLSSAQGQSIPAASLHPHPSYRSSSTAYDIALIRLSRPIVFDSYTQPVRLPNNTVESVLDVAGKFAVVSGWGITETGSTSDDLREVSIPITPNPTSCGGSRTPANTICGESYQQKDSCNGDSGGPLAQSYEGSTYVLGIVSYGPQECRGYGVYTRVNAYLDWIRSVSGVGADGPTTPAPAPTPTPGQTTYTGTLTSGQTSYAPSTTGFAYAGGTIRGDLTGPSGTDFDLYLQKKASTGSWSTVARSEGSTSSESVSYSAGSGTYRWAVHAYSGSGNLQLVETK
ncbi:serine protease [Deinococcus sp. SL84]|uniref:serine protease n=1 Tax=Deinococcus sp. SL84 TaxID=2994663 RepID=UPI0022723A5B|nr:serine protease [Deinococcus sp. SL84]MCY1704252.1 serine protease [Deinococcus sp. SL84]